MKKKWSDFYTDGSYFEKHPTWDEADSAWKAGHIQCLLAKNYIQPESVCEVGCGAGGILERLHDVMPDKTTFAGYEISPQAHELSLKKTKDRLQFFLKDILQEPMVSYDLLLAIDVIEHIEDPFEFLREIKGKANYKIFHIPLDMSVQKVLLNKPLIKRRTEVGHIHYFNKETALSILTETDYQIIDYIYTAEALELPSDNFIYKPGRLALRIACLLNRDLAVRILGGHSLLVIAK